MRIAILLVALIGCERGPQPQGTIRGRVKLQYVQGGTDEHGNAVFVDQPLACSVRITDGSGKKIGEAPTNASGAFELRVPVGRYRVSFESCPCDDQAAQQPRIVDVHVTSGADTVTDWVCSPIMG